MPVMHAEISLPPIFPQDLWSSAVVTIGFSVWSFTEALSPRLLILWNSHGCSNVLLLIFQIYVLLRSCL